jgi:hypothetical protein
VISGLDKKEINQNIFAENLISDPDLISEYLDGLLSKNETYRYNCFKVLYAVSEKKPDLLYPYWNFFVDHLNSKNSYHKMSAVLIITNLTAVDKDQKFEVIFHDFFNNIKSEKTIVPIFVVKSSSTILSYKPHLERKITELLLNIEQHHQGKQIELVKSAVIESFSKYFQNSSRKDEIISFVSNQLDSWSPKTKKTAKAFISKWLHDK